MAVHDLVTVFWVEDEQDMPTIRVTMGHALTLDQETIAVYPPEQTTAVQIPRRDMLLRVEIAVRETGQDGYPWNIHVRTHSNDGEGEHHEQKEGGNHDTTRADASHAGDVQDIERG